MLIIYVINDFFDGVYAMHEQDNVWSVKCKYKDKCLKVKKKFVFKDSIIANKYFSEMTDFGDIAGSATCSYNIK